jgi:hypothetical protein
MKTNQGVDTTVDFSDVASRYPTDCPLTWYIQESVSESVQ